MKLGVQKLRFAVAALAAMLVFSNARAAEQDQPPYDIVIYGDSSGAVTAAISAKREGHSVILVNPTAFPGGMSASGLGATDFLGRQNTFGGIAAEFYKGIAEAYGADFVRSFEPHVGLKVFRKMIADAGVTVVYNEMLDRTPGKGVKMNGKRIESITTLSGKTYRGKMFIDATYVGDLMAAAGVTYTVGREPESQYGEDMAGVRRGDTKPRVHYTQKDKDHFIKEVDPYVKPGDPASGLLPYVFKIEGLKNGQGDRKIQAYNYRVCLTTDPKLRIPIEKPAGYREIDHELLLRNFDAGDTRLPALIEPLEGGRQKVDWNNMHAVGSDHPGANWDYPEASYERRREIEREHETYIRGFLWTMANNPRVPEAIRERTAAYGLPKDEFTDNGGWPWMIYIREARRMVSDYVMTQHDCMGKQSAPDPVALGSFGMDSHCVQHFVTEKGHANNDGVIWRVPPKPYGISYRSIIPRKGECENLFSPVCLGASHVAHGSIRMEPVFMALSQSAAIAAGLAIDGNMTVQEVPYPALREKLLAANQILAASHASVSNAKPVTLMAGPATGTPKQPNLVLLLADDLGYGDLGITGSKQIPTPHIDSLAAEGVRFTNAYVSSSVCAPSRAGMMTGKHPASFGFRDNLAPVQPGHDPECVGLPINQTTLADRLKELGYTTGLVGKWHLGELPKFNPLKRGFDEFWGWLGGSHDYFRAESGGERQMAGPILCSYKKPAPLTYLTDDQGNECVDFIRRHRDRPFFLFASFAAPHSPMQATEEDLRRFAHIKDRQRRTYCAMVHRLDQNVGRILDELRAQGIERDTLVVFLSDNGGPCAPGINNGSVNAPFRGSKTTVLEGGIRVPMIFKLPANIPPGKTNDAMVSSLDIFPTFVSAAGGAIKPSDKLNGVGLLPFLTGKSEQSPHDSLMWTYTVGSAIRSGDWKLIRLPDRLPMLYQLSADPGERNDLALKNVDRTQTLLRELGHWEVQSPNPVFREPADWRMRHLKFYDSDYQMTQPEQGEERRF